MADWTIGTIFFGFIFWSLAVLGIIQLAQILFPVLGLDKSKFYIYFMKQIRKLSLRGKYFTLIIKKSYDFKTFNDNFNEDIKKFFNKHFSEFEPKFLETDTKSKIAIILERNHFNMNIDIYFHETNGQLWMLVNHYVKVNYSKINDALNTVFNNLNRFDYSDIEPISDKVDVIIDADEVKLFKALLEEIGTLTIGNGNISLIQEDSHTFIQITDKPEVELGKKVTDFFELGHV